MTTPPELAALDPFDLFDAEASRLDRFFSRLDDTGWARPSRCAGWSVRDVLAHLAGEELYNHACLDGNLAGFFDLVAATGNSLAGFNDWTVRERRGLPIGEVLDEWRSANGATRQRMRRLGRDANLQTGAGPYPVGLQTFHYASEYATHADDVGAPVAPDEEPGRTSWRVSVGRFVLIEQDRPVDFDATDNGVRVRTADVSADLSAADFVAATVDRLPDDHPLDLRLRDVLACLA